jgi:crotonobetainyl-CoA:carnitine CoA-transferase CaiB-like acyl-CoA transferase
MLVEYDHPVAGNIRVTGSPIQVDSEPAVDRAPPPALGEHTRKVLGEMGVDPETVEKMVAEGRAVAS